MTSTTFSAQQPQHENAGTTAVAPGAWAARIREAGLRVTKPRLAVLDALERSPHATADEVLSAVRTVMPSITVQSVYVVLHSLTKAGLLRQLDLAHSPARYETRVADNHHHAVCTVCGRIEDVACAVGHAPCLAPTETHGMNIHVADVVYQGVCSDCSAQESDTATAQS
ncbi:MULTISPECIES: Fur family transcriptional regulator [unclassified Candidatus Sulfotelmatobacter]|uniref:Fur family transcriptional regulator n=1 Tax=unclassified Candidatus Sulfotelmatobacter TaxID=2635724 RepID=UPI00168601B1|nr:Fur family transcriptional regulator [Kocuria sp. cx-116]MBD2762267.1 transcriptional repressor [Kocuria sp. cx-116]